MVNKYIINNRKKAGVIMKNNFPCQQNQLTKIIKIFDIIVINHQYIII